MSAQPKAAQARLNATLSEKPTEGGPGAPTSKAVSLPPGQTAAAPGKAGRATPVPGSPATPAKTLRTAKQLAPSQEPSATVQPPAKAGPVQQPAKAGPVQQPAKAGPSLAAAPAAPAVPLLSLTLDTFKGDFRIAALSSRIAEPVLDAYHQKLAAAASKAPGHRPPSLAAETLQVTEQLLGQFQR